MLIEQLKDNTKKLSVHNLCHGYIISTNNVFDMKVNEVNGTIHGYYKTYEFNKYIGEDTNSGRLGILIYNKKYLKNSNKISFTYIL